MSSRSRAWPWFSGLSVVVADVSPSELYLMAPGEPFVSPPSELQWWEPEPIMVRMPKVVGIISDIEHEPAT